MQNIGHLFYKRYFKNLDFSIKGDGKIEIQLNKANTGQLTANIYSTNLSIYTAPVIDFATEQFRIITIYPGLLIGSGYNHEIGKQDDELKLGFFFDHTSGLPCIPGSSLKGVLRDACEKDNGNYVVSILEELSCGERVSKVKDEAKKIFEKKGTQNIFIKDVNWKYSEFVKIVFEGKYDANNYIPFKERDIFFDAFPVESKNSGGKFLANDYITHHESEFKNPNPIQFLKVLPQVVFQFNFKLSDKCIPKKIKEELFRQILLDLGVGAKRNVGYGNFQ